MISEGRIIQIMLLIEQAHHKLVESEDFDDVAEVDASVLEAKKLLAEAIEHGKFLDRPVGSEDAKGA